MGLNLLSCLKTIFPVCGSVKEDDRLSSLPDDVIHKILSFLGIKEVIRMSVLSSRWRYIWTSMSYLNFSNLDTSRDPSKFVLSSRWRYILSSMPCLNFSNLDTSRDPSKFVADVLFRRDNLIGLSSIYLKCGRLDGEFVNRILCYALCYNVQQLTLECSPMCCIKFPGSVFSSKSLKHLTLRRLFWMQSNKHASTWELLALTTLQLDYVTFWNDNSDDECIDIFSKCVNLKNLNLNCCTLRGSKGGFRISHPRLSNLTINRGELFTDDHSLQFSTDTLHSLEKLDLCIVLTDGVAASKVFGLLQHLHGVKFLQLNMELVEFLSSSMKLISPPPSMFTRLKSLKISALGQKRPLSHEIKNYFLGSSPNASFTFVPRELFTWN